MTVWDAVILYRELDLLELRLRVLDDVVDKFVVVEATTTFTGLPKPLNFLAAQQRFAPWRHKIVYVPMDLDPDATSAWDREFEQRRGIRRGLDGLAPDDLLILGDVDEVPAPHVVEHLQAHLEVPTRLVQRHALYRANWLLATPWELGSFACRGDQTDNLVVAHMLGNPIGGNWGRYKEPLLPDAGWHFSFLGDIDHIRTKLAAYSHQEENRQRDRDPGAFERMLRYRIDLQGRNLLTVQSQGELDAVQRQLFAMRPAYFDFEPVPTTIRRHAVRSWMWARRSGRLAGKAAFVRWGDRRIEGSGPLALLFVAVMALIDRARDERRRRVIPNDLMAWKRGRRLDPIPEPATAPQTISLVDAETPVQPEARVLQREG